MDDQPIPEGRIDRPGIFDLPAARYHADPCVRPSFSRSIARILCEQSPAHAAAAHPRLGGGGDTEAGEEGSEDETPEDPGSKDARDIGTVAHAMFLRGESVVGIIDHKTYQSKAAKADRAAVIAEGKIPLKRAKYDDTMRLVEALETFRASTGTFTKGRPERTLIWQSGPTWNRCMVDFLPDDPGESLWDLKTTGGAAIARVWTRRCFEEAIDIQAVLYCDGAAELRDGEMPDGMKFCVVEQKPPHGIKVFELSQVALEFARERLQYARAIWDHCQAEAKWPSYDPTPEWIDPPAFIIREWDWKKRNWNTTSMSERETVAMMLRTGNLAG